MIIFGNFFVVIKVLSAKIKKKVAIIMLFLLSLLYIVLYIVLPMHIYEDVFTLSSIVMIILLNIITIQGYPKGQITFLSVVILGFFFTIGTLVEWILIFSLEEEIDHRLIDLISNVLILFVCVITIMKGKLTSLTLNLLRLRVSMKFLLLASIWINALLASIFSFFFHSFEGSQGFVIIGTFSSALMILIGIMCPLLIISNLSSMHYKNLSGIMDKQVRVQVEHYEGISLLNEDVKRFRHDYENLKLGLIEMMKHNDFIGAQALLESDEMVINNTGNLYKTGSVVLDALMSEKQVSASNLNISIKFTGIIPDSVLSTIDICVIFGNALDNAIEACSHCPKEEQKSITVESSFSNGFLFIEIINPVASDVTITNSTIATTKRDRNAHGIGLRSIKNSVDKYNGRIYLSTINGLFILKIDLDFNEHTNQ